MTIPIGFSTGCLYNSGLYMQDMLDAFVTAKADAVELAFSEPSELFGFNTNSIDLTPFKFITIHAPSKGIVYQKGDTKTDAVIGKLQELCAAYPIDAIAIHPPNVSNIGDLFRWQLPFALENMNGEHTTATKPPYFSNAAYAYNAPFILDLQHAYRHDPEGLLARALTISMGDNLLYLHVSGEHKSKDLHKNHELVTKATNRGAIIHALQAAPRKPIILEGHVDGPIDELLREEMRLMRSLRSWKN